MAAKQHAAGVALSLGGIAVATAAVYGLETTAPVLGLGVVYVIPVVLVARVAGLAYAIATSIGAMLAFNFFFLPPLHTFALRDWQNWVALAVYLVTAVVVSELAAGARRRTVETEQRRRESAFLADASALLLESRDLQSRLKEVATGVGSVLGLRRPRIELGSVRKPEAGEVAYDLDAGGRHVGRLFADAGAENATSASRVLPPLASLLGVAQDRERFARAALEAETLRRSDAIKTAVLRSVSHDLRTPLTAINAAAEGLDLDLEPDERDGLLSAIKLEVARLERLVTNLIDLSRLEAGAAAPHPELWPVEELVVRALDVLEAPDRVEVRLPHEPVAARVDAAHVERVLVNLIDNALKFSPQDAPVEVDVAADEESVRIRIRDHGPGLGAGEARHLFEPFQLGRSGRTRGGTGLGLAIARGFALVNGGDVAAAPAEGGGATFIVELPLAPIPSQVRA